MFKKLIIIISSILFCSCDFTTAEEYYNQAIDLNDENRYEEAIILFDKAIEKKENFRPALINRGNNKSIIGDFKGAIKDYETVLEFDPDNTYALVEIAYNWSTLSNHEKSVSYYSKALLTEGATTGHVASTGGIISINTNVELMKHFDNDADYNVLDCIIYYNRGIELIELKQFDKAIIDFNKSIKVKNMVSQSYYFLGQAYYGLNDSISACENFIKSAKLGDEEARKMLEEYCLKQ